jgi:hypothetical protein
MPRKKNPPRIYPCAFPSCPNPSTEFHHITYRPVSGKRLCHECHRKITIINVNQAELIRRRLSNRHRWWIWSRFLKGELHPQMTPRAEAWMKSFRD